MYAVVNFAGTQFLAKPGQKITLPGLNAKAGETIKIPNVLFLKTDNATIIGNPTIKNASIEAKVLANTQGEKVTIYKFIKRENYRRKKGHRQLLSEIEITKINHPDLK